MVGNLVWALWHSRGYGHKLKFLPFYRSPIALSLSSVPSREFHLSSTQGGGLPPPCIQQCHYWDTLAASFIILDYALPSISNVTFKEKVNERWNRKVEKMCSWPHLAVDNRNRNRTCQCKFLSVCPSLPHSSRQTYKPLSHRWSCSHNPAAGFAWLDLKQKFK